MTSAHALIYAVIRDRNVVWFMVAAEGRLVGHGVAPDLSALRGVQIRAGIVEVICTGLTGELPHTDWRKARHLDREQIDNLSAQCGYRFAHPTAA